MPAGNSGSAHARSSGLAPSPSLWRRSSSSVTRSREGYLSPEVRVILAALFGFALIAGAERMRPRDDRVSQALAAAGVAALYGSLLSAVALPRHDLQGRGERRCGRPDGVRDHAVTAPWHPRRRSGLCRWIPEPRHHRQRAAQHAGPVRQSAGHCRRHADRHQDARLVGSGLGRAGGLGAMDRAVDAERSGSAGIALGRTLPCGGRGSLRLGDLAAHAGARESAPGRACAGHGRRWPSPAPPLVLLIVQDSGEQTAGWLALAVHGIGNLCFRAMDAALPVCSRPSTGFVVGGAGPVVVDIGRYPGRLERWPLRLARDGLRWSLRGGGLRSSLERATPGILGRAVSIGGAVALPVRLVRAAAARRPVASLGV